jgi:hypothetical protein
MREGVPCSLVYSPALTVSDMCPGSKLDVDPLSTKSEHCPGSAGRGDLSVTQLQRKP